MQQTKEGELLIYWSRIHQLPVDILRITQYAARVDQVVRKHGLIGPVADLFAEENSGLLKKERSQIVHPIVFVPYEAIRSIVSLVKYK